MGNSGYERHADSLYGAETVAVSKLRVDTHVGLAYNFI